jgi:exoribonuclease II
VPKTAYLIDSIGFMFTKCQNRKSFIYNKLRDFRESLHSWQPSHAGHARRSHAQPR